MEGKPKKLKILCLHGYNNNAETMNFMAAGVTYMMKDIAEFYYLDGPYQVDPLTNPGEPGLLKRGFKGPFNKWFNQPQITPQIRKLMDDYAANKPPYDDFSEYVAYGGIEKSSNEIVNLSKKHGPFDGVLSFSQGSGMFRNFYLYTQILKKESYLDLQFPKFIISFSGAVFLGFLMVIEGKLYGPEDYQISGVNSLHFRGKKDPIFKNTQREPKCYKDSTRKVEVEHEDGHKVLKKYTGEQLAILEEFVKAEYVGKFGSDTGFVLH